MKVPLTAFKKRLGHKFSNPEFLLTALTHSSYVYQGGPGARALCNEQLEFLGDSVLSFLVSDLLVKRMGASAPEGELSLARARLVRDESLADIARGLDLGAVLRLGHGEEANGGRHKSSILAGAFEAVVAALYLDGGIRVVRAFVRREFFVARKPLAWGLVATQQSAKDPKTLLQEHTQRERLGLPTYVVSEVRGPAHSQTFRIVVTVGDETWGEGVGQSKRIAEQAAAREALTRCGA